MVAQNPSAIQFDDESPRVCLMAYFNECSVSVSVQCTIQRPSEIILIHGVQYIELISMLIYRIDLN